LFGLGAVTGGARVKAIVTILLSWVATLPLAAVFGVFFYLLLSAL
jgi:phosphate/sulfate permease